MLQLSVPTAKALIKFASSDKKQPRFYGIGITANGLAATDGFAVVEFTLPLSKDVPLLRGRVVNRTIFETSMKLAAVTKSYMVVKPEHLLEEQLVFPDLAAVMPDNDFPSLLSSEPSARYVDEPVRLAPQYLALLPLVAQACDTETVLLSSVKTTEALRFDIVGPTQSAIVLINHL